MHKHRRRRNIICILLTFFLSVCWFGLFCCIQIQKGFLQEENFRKSLRESGYVTGAWEIVGRSLVQICEENLPYFEAEDILTENEAYVFLNNYIDDVFEGQEEDNAIEEVGNRIRSKLELLQNETDSVMSTSAKQALEQLIKDTQKTIKQYFHPRFVSSFHDFYLKYRGIVKTAAIIFAGGVVLISVLLLLLFRHKHKAVRYLSAGVFGAVIWEGISLAYIYLTQLPQKMLMGTSFYRDFLDCYIRNSFIQWMIMAGIGILLGIAGMFVVKGMKLKMK